MMPVRLRETFDLVLIVANDQPEPRLGDLCFGNRYHFFGDVLYAEDLLAPRRKHILRVANGERPGLTLL